MEKKIFLSYCRQNWDTASLIDSDFGNMGVTFIRDIRDVNYRDNFRHFMRKYVRESDFIVMLISDEFLRSEFCMFEVCELLTDLRFEERLLPVILKNAEGIFTIEGRSKYVDYWSKKIEVAKNLSQKYNTVDSVQERKKTETIFNNLDDFFVFIKDINIISFQELKRENYHPMLKTAGYENSILISRVQKINEIQNEEDKEWELDQFLQMYPYNLSALYLKIDFCEKRNELIKVKRYLEIILDKYPKEAQGYCEMARLLFTTAKYEDAKIYIDKALTLEENSSRIHGILALLYFQFLPITNLDLARNHIEKVIELSPSENAYDFLYRVAYQQEDYETAKTSIIRLLDYNPKAQKAYKNLGALSKLSGDNNNALLYFKKEIEINPSNYEVYYLLGECMREEERFAEATEYFAKYLFYYPENYEVHHVLGLIYANNFDNTSLALFHLKKAAELDPLSKAYYDIGIIYQDKLKQYDKAEDPYRKFLQANPLDYGGNVRLGLLLLQMNRNINEIKIFFLKAIEIKPEDYLGYKSLGSLEMYKLENYQIAKEYFEKASSLNPQDGEIYYHLAIAIAKIEGPSHAENYLKKAESSNYITTEVLFILACIEIDKPLPNQAKDYYQRAKNLITSSTNTQILQDLESSAQIFMK